jgi:hypothetical protein
MDIEVHVVLRIARVEGTSHRADRPGSEAADDTVGGA